MYGDDAREKLDRLREQQGRDLVQLDEGLRAARQRKGRWGEDEIEYWLHPALHHVLGALTTLSERMTNLEDAILRAIETPDRHSELARTTYLTDRDRQELEAASALLGAERQLIRHVMREGLSEPVTPADRANMSKVLLGIFDRLNALDNEVRELRGLPPLSLPET